MKRQSSLAQAPAVERDPTEVLYERGIYADWYMRHRLQEELERALRYQRPISMLVASPDLLEGEKLGRTALDKAVRGAREVSRASDLIGWWGEQSVIMIMPETTPDVAEIAARRWRDEMWMRTRSAGGVKWSVQQLGREQLAAAGLPGA
jgi:hypothetical protein